MTKELGHHCRDPDVHELKLRSNNGHLEANVSS
jgi:hypothetical protein